jgi:hypothetical protein
VRATLQLPALAVKHYFDAAMLFTMQTNGLPVIVKNELPVVRVEVEAGRAF